MKHLYESLRGCAKEEEVKAEFCKFFKMKNFALRGIDHYTERVLFEFKYDREHPRDLRQLKIAPRLKNRFGQMQN